MKWALVSSINQNTVGVFRVFTTTVLCRHIREYHYAYGAIEPLTRERFFRIIPYCNTVCMNIFLKELSATYLEDTIILVCDGVAFHTTNNLEIPSNIRIIYLPTATPEMNPIEQIWKEIHPQDFRNEIFPILNKA